VNPISYVRKIHTVNSGVP